MGLGARYSKALETALPRAFFRKTIDMGHRIGGVSKSAREKIRKPGSLMSEKGGGTQNF